MNLRLATKDDVTLLQYWDTKEHVINSGGTDDYYEWKQEVQKQLPWQEILIAEINNKPIGAIVIIDPQLEDTHYWGKIESNLRALDIWIGEKSNLGLGYGTQMMKLAINRCFTNKKVKAIITDPLTTNVRACKFYEKLGFKKVGRKMFGKDDCFIYRLENKS